MAKFESNSINWNVGETESTSDPSISVMAEEVPTLTVATILGVTIVVLVAIVVVFVLGVLIDWRQQRLIDKKLGDVKRMKKQRRTNHQAESDDVSIANNMEEDGVSPAPAEILRHIP